MIYYPFSPKQKEFAYLFDIASYQMNYVQHFSTEEIQKWHLKIMYLKHTVELFSELHEFYQLSKQYEDYKSINSNKVYNKKRSDVCNWNTYYFS